MGKGLVTILSVGAVREELPGRICANSWIKNKQMRILVLGYSKIFKK
jgi:hypothetical protein